MSATNTAPTSNAVSKTTAPNLASDSLNENTAHQIISHTSNGQDQISPTANSQNDTTMGSGKEENNADINNTAPRGSISSYFPAFISSGINTTMQYLSKSTDLDEEYNKNMLLNGGIPFELLAPKFQSYIIKESQDLLKKEQESYFLVEKVNQNTRKLGVCNSKSFHCLIPIFDDSIIKLEADLSKLTDKTEDTITETRATPSLYVNNSLLLPGASISHMYHQKSLWSQIAMGVKDHYNLEPQRHLYLKKRTSSDSVYFAKSGSDSVKSLSKKIRIVSITCSLPEAYMQKTVACMPSSYELSTNLKKTLLENNPHCDIQTLSISLILQPVEDLLEVIQSIITRQKRFFKDVDAVFFAGYYHTVPLVIQTVESLIKKSFANPYNTEYPFKNAHIGLWGIESCLSSQTFFEHSSDVESNKKLYANCTKYEQDMLKNIHKFASSASLQSSIKWICQKTNVKITLTAKLYDNFMTLSQKLGVAYKHPNIMRNVWVDCNSFELCEPYISKDVENKELDNSTAHCCKLLVPKERCFEISLINNLILAINLGHHEQASFLLEKLAPFFISRSFNENTYPNVLKKKIDKDTREWLIKLEKDHPTWKNIVPTAENLHDFKRCECNSFTDFIEFLKYKSFAKQLVLKRAIQNDEKIYKAFIQNTLFTSSLVDSQKVVLFEKHELENIFDQHSQYEVVWSLHEFLSKFITFKTLPSDQGEKLYTNLCLSSGFLDSQEISGSLEDPARVEVGSKFSKSSSHEHELTKDIEYNRTTAESLLRVKNLYHQYWDWQPPVKGLKTLKKIFSVIEMYSTSEDFIRDIAV
ncbi:hypothetical protein ACO0RG_001310 [Hanseniaspora osmophila]